MSWRIQLLGGLRVRRLQQECADEDAPELDRFRSRQAGALLAFLSYFLRSHAREELTELLWPGHDSQLSRNHLRVVLSSLRRQLEVPGVPAGSLLQTDRNFVKLNRAQVSTDVADFEATIRSALHAPDRAGQSLFLERAVELYGGVLLPGFYEDWVLPESQRLEECFFTALRRLVSNKEREGDLESALHFARRGASVNPQREDLARDLMRLYAASGQLALSRRQYHELEDALRRALDTSPGPQTRELLRRLEADASQTQSATVASKVTAPSTVAVPVATIVEAASESPEPVSTSDEPHLPSQWTRFFGRETEIGQVRQLLQSARLVTVSGTGGSGKTRLSLEVAGRIASERETGRGAIWFVPLSDLSDARLIAGEIAGALRLPCSGASSPQKRVVQALLSHQEPLLILDNFEQLLPEGAAFVLELLAHVPQLRLLVTSRHELGIAGEAAFALSPLGIPETDSPEALLR